MSLVFFLVFSQLAVGGAVVLALIPPDVWRGFFRFSGVFYLIFMGLSLWAAPSLLKGEFDGLFTSWAGRQLLCFVPFALLMFTYTLTFWADRPRLRAIALQTAILLGGLGVLSGSVAYRPAGAGSLEAALLSLNFLISALTSGLVLNAMVLGHWYLVDVSFTLAPFKRLNHLFLLALLAQAVLLAFSLLIDGGDLARALDAPLSPYGLCLWGRALVGILGAMVLVTLTLHILHHPESRSATQAATGLLYIAVLFVLVGDVLAKFLLVTSGVGI